ncbi:uncharacterized protein J3R85_015192 [Psidium guajava]|nr:uncharacterized protein J3R85_015192 [Psidium guajava]
MEINHAASFSTSSPLYSIALITKQLAVGATRQNT